MTEAIIVAMIVQFGLIIVAIINNRKLDENKRALAKVAEHADIASKNADTAAAAAAETNNQFKNNGGSTIKDQMDRIERRFIDHDQRMNLLQQADINDRNAAQSAHKAIYDAIHEVAKDVSDVKNVVHQEKD